MPTVTSVLNVAADLFEASPRQTFTRAEVVNILRALPDEIESVAMEHAGQEIPAQGRPS